VGNRRPKENDKRTKMEKIQDTTRDIFVLLVIFFVFVIPTIYIGVRSFQPMTLPGYEDITFAEYIKYQFTERMDYDVQIKAIWYVVAAPYYAVVDVLSEIFPNIIANSKDQYPTITWKDIPNAWWINIQRESVYWLNRFHSR
jgi:hypothetical protein